MGDSFLLNHDQILFYRENGYLIVPDVLDNGQCDRILDIFTQRAKAINPETNTAYDLEFKGIMNLDRDDHRIRDVLCYYKIVLVLDTLQDAEVVGLQSMFLFKKSGSTQAWNPHQDNAYPRAPHGMYITGNLAFSNQVKENGCMFIYPGSHRESILPAEFFKSFHEDGGKNPGHDLSRSLPSTYQPVDIPMEKGSLLILHGNVAHGSYPNESNRDRPMLLIPYGTKGITKHSNFIAGRTGKREEFSLRPLRYDI
jgi:ectoine hydroxylase-related dioxygenase (phytanoyl-CoA dioxygenase family)